MMCYGELMDEDFDVANFVAGSTNGLQSAGVVNVSGGTVKGLQLGGVLNVAGGEFSGAQLSGVVNVSRGNVYQNVAHFGGRLLTGIM